MVVGGAAGGAAATADAARGGLARSTVGVAPDAMTATRIPVALRAAPVASTRAAGAWRGRRWARGGDGAAGVGTGSVVIVVLLAAVVVAVLAAVVVAVVVEAVVVTAVIDP